MTRRVKNCAYQRDPATLPRPASCAQPPAGSAFCGVPVLIAGGGAISPLHTPDGKWWLLTHNGSAP